MAQAGLELPILLPCTPQSWDHRNVPAHWILLFLFKLLFSCVQGPQNSELEVPACSQTVSEHDEVSWGSGQGDSRSR